MPPPPPSRAVRRTTTWSGAVVNIVDVGYGADETSSSSAGTSPVSLSGPSDSDGSSTADECPSPREFRQISPSSSSVLADIDSHKQFMVDLLMAAAPSRSDALSQWLARFDVAWVLHTDADRYDRLPRREVARKVRTWAQALNTMERVLRLRQRETRHPSCDAAAAQLVALGEFAAAVAAAMLRLADTVAALRGSPSKLLAVLEVYEQVSETCPGLVRAFSWGISHPVPAAADAALSGLVDAARRCVRDLKHSIRSHYSWRMPQGGEVHPCVVFWVGYFRCMQRSRVSLYLVLGDGDVGEGEAAPEEGGLIAGLISFLEAVLEEKSDELAFPGLKQIFMLNNTCAIVQRVTSCDLKLFLPSDWIRHREERMETYIRSYIQASWMSVVSRLDSDRTKAAGFRRQNPLCTFYSAMENACSMQRGWKVPNPVLRAILRRTISESVVPAYRRYLEDHAEIKAPVGRTAEELEHQLWELFEG